MRLTKELEKRFNPWLISVEEIAKQVADEKMIGDVTLMRVRVAHNGASAGWLSSAFSREMSRPDGLSNHHMPFICILRRSHHEKPSIFSI